MLLGERFLTFSKQYSAFILKGLAWIENIQLFIQDIGNHSISDSVTFQKTAVHYWNCNWKCVCAGTEDGGLDSSLTGSQESLYAAEDSSMELEYSSSDKVTKNLKDIIRNDIRFSHFFVWGALSVFVLCGLVYRSLHSFAFSDDLSLLIFCQLFSLFLRVNSTWLNLQFCQMFLPFKL